MNHEIKPVATFGDLVQVVGYGNNLFAVDSFAYEYHHEPGETYLEVIYDLTCVYGDSGYIIGEQDDVSLVCRADKAGAFLRAYKPAPKPSTDKPKWMHDIYSAIENAVGNGGMDGMQTKPTKVAKVKVLTKQQRIDALLDERNDVGITDEFIATQDARYKQHRLDEIDAQLKEVMAE